MSTDAKNKPNVVVAMPDIYSGEDTVSEPAIEVIELAASNDADTEGFNPYDTGRLQRHKLPSSDS